METFVRRFQPEKFELWMLGKDFGCHPEDQSKSSFAPSPFKQEKVKSQLKTEEIDEEIVESYQDAYLKAGENIIKCNYFFKFVAIVTKIYFFNSTNKTWIR